MFSIEVVAQTRIPYRTKEEHFDLFESIIINVGRWFPWRPITHIALDSSLTKWYTWQSSVIVSEKYVPSDLYGGTISISVLSKHRAIVGTVCYDGETTRPSFFFYINRRIIVYRPYMYVCQRFITSMWHFKPWVILHWVMCKVTPTLNVKPSKHHWNEG